MKKLAIGCGIVILVCGVVGAGAAYYLYRQVKGTVAQFAALGQVPDIERDIRNRAVFVPPPSEELTDSQIAKLLQVQTEVRRRLGDRMTAFEAKYKALSEKKDASIADAPQLFQAYSDLASTWLEAKRGQVEALNTAELSLDEYRWIRNEAYRALGMPYVDLDIPRIIQEAQNGNAPRTAGQLQGSIGPAGPESNRTKVEKVKKQLEQNIALASFGL